MKTLIVIVNYQTAELTLDCLRSLEPQVAGARVVVIDNHSPDDSLARLRLGITRNNWRSWASLTPLGRNGGFAFGNNAAIRRALAADDPPDYVLLLNPDTIVRRGALDRLIVFMDRHPRVGIAGSRLEHRDSTPQQSAFRFPCLAGEFERALRLAPVSRCLRRYVVAPPVPQSACRTDWVAGAAMIIRRQVFHDIGLLDEGFFMYFEELDFCRRAAAADWPCWYVPDSRIIHLVGKASGVTDIAAASRRRPAYWFHARSRYFRKHHGRLGKTLIDLTWVIAFSLFKLRCQIQRKPAADPPHLLSDFIRHNFYPFARRHRPPRTRPAGCVEGRPGNSTC